MAAISNSAILDSAISTKKTSLMHSHSNWWWQPSWILLSWIQHKKIHLFILQLDNGSHLEIRHLVPQKNLLSCILTQLHDGNHLEICHHGFSHFAQSDFKLIHSHLTWWWQSSWIWPSLIQPSCTKVFHSCIHTQLDDGSHLEFCKKGFQLSCTKKTFTHSFWLNLMIAAILNSAMLDSDTAILDSDTLLSSLRFTQKHSPSILTLTQTNSIWLKLIHSHLTWWWQSSWIWPSLIQPS